MTEEKLRAALNALDYIENIIGLGPAKNTAVLFRKTKSIRDVLFEYSAEFIRKQQEKNK